MAIFFDCDCGQPLRADEEQEGGTRECLACGRAVHVPSIALANLSLGIDAVPRLELSSRPAPAPLPLAPAAPPIPILTEEDLTYPLAPLLGRDLSGEWGAQELKQVRERMARARRELTEGARGGPSWSLETAWWECLAYPFRAWPILALLAFFWATVVAILVGLFPLNGESEGLMPWLFGLLLLFGLLSYTWTFYRCVFLSGLEGEAGFIRWPRAAGLPQILWSGAAALLCFLAGPVVPAITALLFWLNSGDPEAIDYFILGDLGLAAAGSWILAQLAVWESGRLRNANPAAWVGQAARLGWRGWLAVTLTSAGLVGHGLLVWNAVEQLHQDAIGWLLLVWWGFWGAAWVVFLLRWHGVSRFRAREAERGGRKPSASGGHRPRTGEAPAVLPGALPPEHMRI